MSDLTDSTRRLLAWTCPDCNASLWSWWDRNTHPAVCKEAS